MKDNKIDKYIIYQKSTMKEAMETIEKGARGIAFVLDENARLVGTVTDGDIRRAILKGKTLNEEISDIMNDHFIFVSPNYTKRLVETIYNQKAINQIPVLDDNMRLVDILFYNELSRTDEKDTWIIIMAGGLGTRLAALTKEMPKPMLRVGDKPILETLIMQLKSYGYKNIILSLNYKSDIIKNYFQDGSNFGVRIEYVLETKRLGTAGSIRLAKTYLDKPFFVVNGDILTKLNFEQFMNFHVKHKNKITIGTRSHEFLIPYGVVDLKGENVTDLVEKPKIKYFVNGGMYCLEPDVIEMIPDDSYFDITQLIKELLLRNEKVGSFPITEYWMDIGQVDDYNQANVDYINLFGDDTIES